MADEEFTRCIHCNGRIERVRWALGDEWMHWPSDYGNYRVNEYYRHCRNTPVATPPPDYRFAFSADGGTIYPYTFGGIVDFKTQEQAEHTAKKSYWDYYQIFRKDLNAITPRGEEAAWEEVYDSRS